MRILSKIDKKYKYLIQTIISTLLLYLIVQYASFLNHVVVLLVLVLFSLIGSLLFHHPNITLKNLPFSILLPLCISFGFVLYFRFFPNLGLPFRVASYAIFAGIYYLVLLMDNIFLVVQSREDTIPLYRVAITWSQILQVIIAIPLFAGIFKTNLNGIYQSILIGIISFAFCIYQIWVQHFDEDSKSVRVGEVLILGLICAYLVLASSIAISFIPTEAFLRALMVCTVLMFGLVYVAGYLKNEINKKTIFQYSVSIIIFLILLLIFQP